MGGGAAHVFGVTNPEIGMCLEITLRAQRFDLGTGNALLELHDVLRRRVRHAGQLPSLVRLRAIRATGAIVSRSLAVLVICNAWCR